MCVAVSAVWRGDCSGSRCRSSRCGRSSSRTSSRPVHCRRWGTHLQREETAARGEATARCDAALCCVCVWCDSCPAATGRTGSSQSPSDRTRWGCPNPCRSQPPHTAAPHGTITSHHHTQQQQQSTRTHTMHESEQRSSGRCARALCAVVAADANMRKEVLDGK